MNLISKIKEPVIKTVIILGIGFSSGGCFMPDLSMVMESPAVYQNRIDRQRGGIVAIEGFQGLTGLSGCRCTEVGSEFAKKYDKALSASSGDWRSHIPFVGEISKYNGDLTFIGYSAGCQEVRLLAEYCNENYPNEKIKIIFMDPTFVGNVGAKITSKIPENVYELVSIRGEDGFWGGVQNITEEYLKNPNKTKLETFVLPRKCLDNLVEHLKVPEREDTRKIIDEEFQEIQE
jgi:hypothetical protein